MLQTALVYLLKILKQNIPTGMDTAQVEVGVPQTEVVPEVMVKALITPETISMSRV